MNQTTNWNSVGLTCVAQGNQNFQAKKEVLDYHTINKRGDWKTPSADPCIHAVPRKKKQPATFGFPQVKSLFIHLNYPFLAEFGRFYFHIIGSKLWITLLLLLLLHISKMNQRDIPSLGGTSLMKSSCWHFTSPHVKQSVFCLSRGAFEPLGRQICRFTGGSSSPRPNIRARRRYRGSPMRDGTGFQTALHFEDGRMSLLGVGVGMITVVGITTGFEPGIQPPCSYKGIYFELCFLPTNVLVRLPSHS